MNAVVVEVVEDGQAVLVGASLLQLSVVRLRLADASVLRPVVLSAIRGWREFLQLRGPEPAVNRCWLQIGSVAAFEVAQSSTGPNVLRLEKEKEIYE